MFGSERLKRRVTTLSAILNALLAVVVIGLAFAVYAGPGAGAAAIAVFLVLLVAVAVLRGVMQDA